MPDIVRLRFIGAVPVNVPSIAHGPEGVEPDSIVEFPGRVVTEPPEGVTWLDDAIHIDSGNPPEVRAWPKSLWRDETPVSNARKPKE
jgi:hypothetical protein